jgi:hypothetical protein
VWGGLLKTPKEKRGYSFGAIFGYLDPKTLPDEFTIGEPLEIKNQLNTFTCVAHSFTSLSEFQERVLLAVEYVIKLISQELKDASWVYKGTSLSIINKIAGRGCIEKSESPYTIAKDGIDKVAEPVNWADTYDILALKHAKKAVFWIGEHGDMFNSIRSALYQFRDEKRAVQTGIMWNTGWEDFIYIDKKLIQAGGHSFHFIGWKGDYLKLQNSIGNIGENGCQYLHKSLVNELLDYGALMCLDMPPMTKEEILVLSEKYRKQKISIIQKLLVLFNQLLDLINAKYTQITKDTVITELEPEPEPVEMPPEAPAKPAEEIKYLWDTPGRACHSVRVICDEMGLSVADKNLICQVINAESGFKIQAKNINKDGTGDYGICQFNSYWYIGPGKPIASIDEALNNPEKCVRVMIKQFKAGRLKDWCAYSSGAYLKYPSKIA